MPTEPTRRIHGRDPSSRTARSRSGFEHLSPELQDEAYRRLAGVALIYFGTYLFFFVLEWAARIQERNTICAPETHDWIRGVVSLGMALAVFALSSRRAFPPRSFLNVAILFEVLGA